MQTLDVISVNLWQILISLCNLFLLFLLFKKFLFKPVKNVLEKRQTELDTSYEKAAMVQAQADEHKRTWEDKLAAANSEADAILQNATENARRRGDKIVSEAQMRADGMIRVAQTEVELERRKADEDMKREIVVLSSALAEKMLGREIKDEDHRAMIDEFLCEIGGEDD